MLGNRLRQMRGELSLTRKELAERSGVSPTTIANLEQGRNRSSRMLVPLAEALNVTPEWLEYGAVRDISNPTGNTVPSTAFSQVDVWTSDNPPLPYEVEVPFLKDLHVKGNNILKKNLSGKTERLDSIELLKLGISPQDVVGFFIEGDSMHPLLPDGCTVYMDTNDRTIRDGKCYAINNNGLLQVKILSWKTGATIVLDSRNDAYPSAIVLAEEVEVIGRIFKYSVNMH